MSYCRWSSDDFNCDLYIYEHVDETWTIHVAANRVIGDVPPVVWPTDPKDKAQLAACVESHKARSAFLDAADHEPLWLPHDGETIKCASPDDCADTCERLAALGYRFPDYVIPALREEAAAIRAQPGNTQ